MFSFVVCSLFNININKMVTITLETCAVTGTTVIPREICGNRNKICGNTAVMGITTAGVTVEIVAKIPLSCMHS